MYLLNSIKNEIIESLIISNQGEYKLSTVEVDNIKKIIFLIF